MEILKIISNTAELIIRTNVQWQKTKTGQFQARSGWYQELYMFPVVYGHVFIFWNSQGHY